MKRLVLLGWLVFGASAQAQAIRLAGPGSPARMMDHPPPAEWDLPGLDDASWHRAPLPLAFTAVPARTLYVRVPFELGAEAARLRSLDLRVRFSGGLVARIDGVELGRRALPRSLAAQKAPREESYIVPLQGPARQGLAPGPHVLALELAQPEGGSTVGLELTGSEGVRIVHGPYLVRPAATEMTIVWETDADAPGTVVYGTEQGPERRVTSSLPMRHHALRLRDLHPSRTYRYRVEAGTSVAKGSFHTLPERGEPLRIGVFGDTRNGHDAHGRIVAQLLTEDPDLLLSTGDLIESGANESDWLRYFATAAPLLARVPLVAAIGNHDYAGPGGLGRVLELFPPPAGAPEPGYFSLEVAGVHITVLNSNELRSTRQLLWCESDLRKAERARLRFVLLHHGPWSTGVHGDNPDLQRTYVPLFRRYRVDLVLSGHDHLYERGRVQGLDYIVTGGGGAPLYQPRCGGVLGPCPETVLFVAPEYHYLTISVDRRSFRVCTKKLDGMLLEPCIDYVR